MKHLLVLLLFLLVIVSHSCSPVTDYLEPEKQPPVLAYEVYKNWTVSAGDTVSFSVLATGFEPFEYQWYLDDVALPHENSDTITILGCDTTHSGSYICIVKNSVGADTSEALDLNVRTN